MVHSENVHILHSMAVANYRHVQPDVLWMLTTLVHQVCIMFVRRYHPTAARHARPRVRGAQHTGAPQEAGAQEAADAREPGYRHVSGNYI